VGGIYSTIDMTLSEKVCDKALALGFDLVGIAPALPVPHLDAYQEWLVKERHGQMAYLARPDRVERRRNPEAILPGVRSVVCVGLNYYACEPASHPADDPARGRISRYAWGIDYHDLMLQRLEELAAYAAAEADATVNHRAYVDTGPILERAYAAAAGLGFVGKNTNLIHPRMGSYLFLGELLIGTDLNPTPNTSSIDCGTCRRCLDACPTGALVTPYVLDARRCISYLTIELKGAIPHDLRPLMGNWIYGCDVCQEVCPWQRFAQPTAERAFLPKSREQIAPHLADMSCIDEIAFAHRYQGSPIVRIGRSRLLRNVAVALGNWRDEQAITPLRQLLGDPEPLVRSHAAWALGRIEDTASRRALERAWRDETDKRVRQDIQIAMGGDPSSKRVRL
jgi:epoxyqueuosine reductase